MGGGGRFEGNPPNELTVHISNTCSVKPPTTVIFTDTHTKTTLAWVNVKILSPAAFQSKVCGRAGEVAAGTDHIQDVGAGAGSEGIVRGPQTHLQRHVPCRKGVRLSLPALSVLLVHSQGLAIHTRI